MEFERYHISKLIVASNWRREKDDLLQQGWSQEKVCTETSFMLEKIQINRQPEQHWWS